MAPWLLHRVDRCEEILGGELDVETINGETAAGDTDEERHVPRAGYWRALI